MDLNHVIIVGRVTKNPELKSIPSGQQVTSFSIATNRRWTDKQGQKQEQTEFHNIVLWGRTAEVACQFLVKGSECLIEGRLQTRKWEDKKSGGMRYTTEIVGENLSLGSKPSGAKLMQKDELHLLGTNQPAPPLDLEEEINPNEIPF